MQTAFKFRLYPNRKQRMRMLDVIEGCRKLWNDALSHRMRRWEGERKSTSYGYQCRILMAEMKSNPALQNVYSQSAQDVLRRLAKAFDAFFAGSREHPKFKKYREYGSFTYPQAYNGSVKLYPPKKRIFLSKIGNVKIVVHRPIPPEAKLKTCTVKCERDGKWYVCLVLDDDTIPPGDALVPASWKSPIGVDLGLNSLIATSDGEKVEPPEFLRKAEKKLKRLQRGLSNKQKRSNNWTRARLKLAAEHVNVSNQRRDFNHKLSRRLVQKYDLVVFEDLQIKNMIKNHALAKSVMDAAWGQLVAFSEYKAKSAKKFLIKVPPQHSTQECCFCGVFNQVPLSVREFECRGCGRLLDRDRNAARVVLKRGILRVGQDKASSRPQSGKENPYQTVPELKPVEIGPLPPQTTEAANPVDETGTTRDWAHSQQKQPVAGNRRFEPTEDVTAL